MTRGAVVDEQTMADAHRVLVGGELLEVQRAPADQFRLELLAALGRVTIVLLGRRPLGASREIAEAWIHDEITGAEDESAERHHDPPPRQRAYRFAQHPVRPYVAGGAVIVGGDVHPQRPAEQEQADTGGDTRQHHDPGGPETAHGLSSSSGSRASSENVSW